MIATIILLALHAASIGVNLAKHGEKKIEVYNGSLDCRFVKFDIFDGSYKDMKSRTKNFEL